MSHSRNYGAIQEAFCREMTPKERQAFFLPTTHPQFPRKQLAHRVSHSDWKVLINVLDEQPESGIKSWSLAHTRLYGS